MEVSYIEEGSIVESWMKDGGKMEDGWRNDGGKGEEGWG